MVKGRFYNRSMWGVKVAKEVKPLLNDMKRMAAAITGGLIDIHHGTVVLRDKPIGPTLQTIVDETAATEEKARGDEKTTRFIPLWGVLPEERPRYTGPLVTRELLPERLQAEKVQKGPKEPTDKCAEDPLAKADTHAIGKEIASQRIRSMADVFKRLYQMK